MHGPVNVKLFCNLRSLNMQRPLVTQLLCKNTVVLQNKFFHSLTVKHAFLNCHPCYMSVPPEGFLPVHDSNRVKTNRNDAVF